MRPVGGPAATGTGTLAVGDAETRMRMCPEGRAAGFPDR